MPRMQEICSLKDPYKLTQYARICDSESVASQHMSLLANFLVSEAVQLPTGPGGGPDQPEGPDGRRSTQAALIYQHGRVQQVELSPPRST